MSRSLHNTEQRANKVPNYAQAAKTQQQQQTRGHQPQQQQETDPDKPTYVKNNYYKSGQQNNSNYQGHKNSYNNRPKDNSFNNYNRKAPVQLPMNPPTDTAPIQFGSVNQSTNSSAPIKTGNKNSTIAPKVGDASNSRASEVQFGSLSPVTDSSSSYRPPLRQPHSVQKDIPRPPRTNTEGRLFTQSYVPRRDMNQGEPHYNNNNYYNNNSNYRNNNYVRPSQPHHSPNQPYHHHQGSYSPQQIHHSPQQQQQQPQQPHNLPPSPMSHRASPNLNPYNPTKKSSSTNLSPHMPQASPQNVQMTATWSPAGQFYYPSHQFPVTVTPYTLPTVTRSPVVPQPPTRKVIAIVDPQTGTKLNTSQMAPVTTHSSPSVTIEKEKPFDFVKPPHVSKAVDIVDPAIRDRELREKKEREEAELEAQRKLQEEQARQERERIEREERERLEKERIEREEREREEQARLEAERLEKERLEKERLEKERLEKERLEKERLEKERLEKERLEKERAEQEEKERLEKERLEKERLEKERVRLAEEALAAAAASLEKKRKEEELRRKEEEERESKRIISELEAERKKNEGLPSIETATTAFSNSPASSPVLTKTKPKTFKLIDDFKKIQYPASIVAPEPHTGNKLVYSTEFLMQFRQLCFDTAEDLSLLFKELGSSDNSQTASRSNSQSMRQNSGRGRGSAPPTPHMSGEHMFRVGSRDGGRMEMGKFNVGRPLTPRNNNNNNNNNMERQNSIGMNRGGMMMNRGGGRGGMTSSGMKIIRNPPQQNSGPGAPTIPYEQVQPLERSSNRWVPTVAAQVAQAPAEGELMSQEYITRKVNALLNKLTVEKFDSISKQIFEYARQSEKEDDGRSLRTVMKLTFEKACDEPAFVSMWARLCRSMYDAMTDTIHDVSILDDNKEPVRGMLLFRKYLFNRCQSEFEKGWKVNMPESDDAEFLLSDEYYIAAKIKRQGLGLIQFIGELFKLEMLSMRIMSNCILKLCNDPLNAGDEEAESLCKLLTTVGDVIDRRPKANKWLDVIISRMKNEMMVSPKLSSRVRFMIQDLLDLRQNKWVPRNNTTQVGPTTLAKIHEMAEKAKEEKEAANMKRTNSARGPYIPNNNQYNNNNNNMNRTGSFRGGKDSNYYQNNNNNNSHYNNNNNNQHHHNNNGGDGWNTVSPAANKNRLQDMTNFGKTDRSRPKTNTLSPSYGPFASLGRGKLATADNKSATDGRSSPAINMFSALGGAEKSEEHTEDAVVDKPVSQPPAKAKLSEDAIKRKCKNILEEYFSINDKTELYECVKELDEPEYIVAFVGEMLNVVEKKADDVQKMSNAMKYLSDVQLLQKDLVIKAFKNFMELYDDITIDVPQAPKYVAQLLITASVTPEDVGGDEFNSLKNAYKALVESS